MYDTTTAIQLKKSTAGEFFGDWLKYKVQLQRKSKNNASSLGLCFMPWHIEKQLCNLTLLLAAICVDPTYQSKIFSENNCTSPFGSIVEGLANAAEIS